jgi:hypothetical protein
MAEAIETILYSALAADDSVSAIVGIPDGSEIAGVRAYPVVIPQATQTLEETYPCIVYRRTGTAREEYLKGNAGIAVATIQLDCLAVSYSAVKALAQAVRLAILTLSGTVDEQIVQGIHLTNESDSYYNDVVVEGKAGVFAVELQYAVTYLEQAA